MNTVKKNLVKVKGLLRTRVGVAATSSVCLALVIFAVWAHAPIVKIGANSTTYTYADIQEVYSFSNQVAAIGPRGNKATTNRDAVFQSLMIAGIQKEILEARKVSLGDLERATSEILANSPYGGLLAREKERVGEERFQKLFIVPVLVDKYFGNYYLARDPNRATAETALRVAQESGIYAAAQKAGVQVKRSIIPVARETAQLVDEARKSIGAVLPKFVEDSSGYAILHVVDVNDTQLVGDIAFIPRQPIGAFVESELKKANIPVEDRFYSWFRVSRLKEAGGILAVAQANKTAAKKEGE